MHVSKVTKMFKRFKLKLLITLLVLITLFIGLSFPVHSAGKQNPTSKSTICKEKKDDDDPWDPGDEFVPVRPSELRSGKPSPNFLLAKRSDDPWDPGDENPHKVEVRDVL